MHEGDSFANGPGATSGSQNNGGPGGLDLHPPFHACTWCLMDGPKTIA